MDVPSPREPYVATITNLAVRLDAELRRHDDQAGSNAQTKVDYAAVFARYDQARADDPGRLGMTQRLIFTAMHLKAAGPGSLAYLAGHICAQAAEVLDIAGVENPADRDGFAGNLDKTALLLEAQAKACREFAEQMRSHSRR